MQIDWYCHQYSSAVLALLLSTIVLKLGIYVVSQRLACLHIYQRIISSDTHTYWYVYPV